MRNFVFALLLLFSPASDSSRHVREEYVNAYNATFDITQVNKKESSDCTSTAIGPQALLTATHCELPSNDLVVVDRPAVIVDRIRDNNDHTIYLVDFPDGKDGFPVVAKIDQNKILRTEEAFIFGSPGSFSYVFRKGVFSGITHVPMEGVMMLFDMQTYNGDSGSGIFRDDDGTLVGVVSAAIGEAEDNARIQFMVAYPMHFMPEDLKRAQEYRHVYTTSNTPAGNEPAGK
jgi:hypothetical protein